MDRGNPEAIYRPRREAQAGWSDDSIDRKINKLEQMGLVTRGRGLGVYYTATAQSGSLLGFAGDANDPGPAFARKLAANEKARDANSLLDALKAAKQQLKGDKSSAA